ncbi:hypothetical protein VFPPC_15238 [Pochonia chlamydosporia 170]|uniref:Uncharacterized protein n=1 Tax=Pochonia chlamydosporia 170 TaxID=1380566 RepID=A0A179G598_METCM|nr:hypothetical protein VFPPC_15238 [Pochonia chlamydosporia 170]OAQ73024.1 hypothetical protein VFPPC_15238 [Pochonia chlamydosporia 170]
MTSNNIITIAIDVFRGPFFSPHFIFSTGTRDSVEYIPVAAWRSLLLRQSVTANVTACSLSGAALSVIHHCRYRRVFLVVSRHLPS